MDGAPTPAATPGLQDQAEADPPRGRSPGTDKLDPVHPWQLLEASRSGLPDPFRRLLPTWLAAF
jgi:hypothetical protein